MLVRDDLGSFVVNCRNMGCYAHIGIGQTFGGRWRLVLSFYVRCFCSVNNNSVDQMMHCAVISSITSVKVQDNRSRPSCNEPSRSSSTSSGAANTQDPRKKTSELTREYFRRSVVKFATTFQTGQTGLFRYLSYVFFFLCRNFLQNESFTYVLIILPITYFSCFSHRSCSNDGEILKGI